MSLSFCHSILLLFIFLLEVMRHKIKIKRKQSEPDRTEKLLLLCTGWCKGHLILFYTQNYVLPGMDQSLSSVKVNGLLQNFQFKSCSEAGGALQMQQCSGSVAEALLVPQGRDPAELFSSTGHGATGTTAQKVVLEPYKLSVLFDSKF